MIDPPRSPADAAGGARALIAGVQAGERSTTAGLDACLEAIGAIEDRVGAWEHLAPAELLRETARAVPRDRPLAGLPVGVKDIIDTADMPTGYGSRVYASNRPGRDARCVALLREAGAIIVGKTVSSEFALWTPGRTANPHDPACSPGGSSSGSAAAVAAGMVAAAVGTQTGGSIIVPAAFCGVVGYKPSFGTVGRSGVMVLSDELDTVGAFAQDVSDAGLLVAAMSGRWDLAAVDVESLARARPKIGLVRSRHWAEADATTQELLVGAADALVHAGAEVQAVELPPDLDDLQDLWGTIVRFDAARNLAHEWRAHRGDLSPALQALLAEGWAIEARSYDDAVRAAAAARHAFDGLAGRFDALLTPSVAGEAVRSRDSIGSGLFDRDWTLLHGPSIHLPLGTGPSRMPIGVQLVGRRGSDRRLLAVAGWAHSRILGGQREQS